MCPQELLYNTKLSSQSQYAKNVISHNLLRGGVTTNIFLQMIIRR